MPYTYGYLVVPRAVLHMQVVLGRYTREKNQSCSFISGAWGDFYDLMEQAHSAV